MNYMINKRYYGLDLMKIFAMFMVIILHINVQGGIYNNLQDGTTQKYIILIGEILCLCAVNCFALISGYLEWKSNKLKPFKIVNIWGQCSFYCLLFTLLAMTVKVIPFSIKAILSSIFPICSSAYWYITAYVAMYIISPILNKAIQSIDSKTLNKITFLLIGFIVLGNLGDRDPLQMNEGYSFVWLSIMYFFGGIISKYNLLERLSIKRSFIFLFVCNIFSFVIYVLENEISKNDYLKNAIPVLRYDSLFIILNAIFILSIFEKIVISEKQK